MVSLDELVEIAEAVGNGLGADSIQMVLVYRETGHSKFVEFSGGEQFKVDLDQAMQAGAMLLGVLAFKFEDKQVQSGRLILPWLKDDPEVVTAFQEICDEAVQKVGEDADLWDRTD
jgi:hypothetical protein